MHTSFYLYELHPEDFMYLPYIEALRKKLESGKELHAKLYFIKDKTFAEEVHLFFVSKAVKHTEKLIEECEVKTYIERQNTGWIKTLFCKVHTRITKILQCQS